MLAKELRLNLRREFHKVVSGKRVESVPARIYYLSGQRSRTLIGISVSGKVFKNATGRNRARRLISKAFEDLYAQIMPGLKIIAMPRESVLSRPSAEMTQLLEKALRTEGLIK